MGRIGVTRSWNHKPSFAAGPRGCAMASGLDDAWGGPGLHLDRVWIASAVHPRRICGASEAHLRCI
ncbi:hypothetical protein BN940_15921 [Castellaniella defragrans 65Phen]|uniref:Uncharacterized protein n=1 Tax=Castellaniella defragrans (strain DSM 12143 / CCUG 39792 / 65Phen) TaxID=1437824 RepID=W8X9Y3_CASD6|nr:hypothetical protein BN940_15921 [Castellaniella defragrans 65Phen]